MKGWHKKGIPRRTGSFLKVVIPLESRLKVDFPQALEVHLQQIVKRAISRWRSTQCLVIPLEMVSWRFCLAVGYSSGGCRTESIRYAEPVITVFLLEEAPSTPNT